MKYLRPKKTIITLRLEPRPVISHRSLNRRWPREMRYESGTLSVNKSKGVSSSSPRPLKSSGKNRFCAAPDWKYSGSDTAGAKCAKEFLEGHKYDTKKVQSCEAQLVNINNKLVLFQQSQQQHSHEVDVQMKRINGHKEHINEQLKTTQVAKPSCFVCGLKFVCAPMTVRTELCLCLCVLKCSWDGSFISNRFKIIISRHF